MKKMYTKTQLLTMLQQLYENDNKTAFGEETGNRREMPAEMIKRFREKTGRYPAVCGVDLGCYGLQIPFIGQTGREQAICKLAEFAHAGGIVTVSSHWANPNGNDGGDLCRGNLGREDAWEELLTEGTELNTIWKAELLQDARFLKGLCDNDVPVLWRPLHEQNGNWFWFCITQNEQYMLSNEYLIRAWRYVYDLYVNKLNLKNLIWVFSPSYSNAPYCVNDVKCDAMHCYPGDDVVDIVGYDWYTAGGYEIDGGGRTHELLAASGKPLVIAEFGPTANKLAPHDKDQTDDGY